MYNKPGTGKNFEKCMDVILFALREKYFTVDDIAEIVGSDTSARRYLAALRKKAPIVEVRPYRRSKNFKTTGGALYKLDKSRL